jgi:isocitrate/isopropylmalate dehydrogenase
MVSSTHKSVLLRRSVNEFLNVVAMTVRMVNNPASLDTVVGNTNLHMDILSDLATATLAGSIGVAPLQTSILHGEVHQMFEPVHGSGFDIIGRGRKPSYDVLVSCGNASVASRRDSVY